MPVALDRGGHAARTAAIEAPCQGIVATGVEEDQLDPSRAHVFEDVIHLDHVALEVALVFRIGVDRHDVVAATDLDAVPGIEDRRNGGAVGTGAEAAEQGIHVRLGGVELQLDLKAELAQGFGHRGGVIARVGQCTGGVATVADDHRDPVRLYRRTCGVTPGGSGRPDPWDQQRGGKQQSAQKICYSHHVGQPIPAKVTL